MDGKEEKNWIDEMIEMEAIPKAARVETVRAFCERQGISEPTYYYQARKEENQKKILEIALNVAKNEVPEILKVLIDNAKAGKEKSIEMYLDYVVKLAKNLDIKSDGKPLIQIAAEVAQKYGITAQDPSTYSKG